MDISFQTSRDGNKICSVNGYNLHSAYKPFAEAEKFCTGIHCQYLPEYILITEPALSYCLPFLQKKFPDSKICAVRFCNYFDDYNSGFHKIFYFCDAKNDLCSQLIYYFSEEGISSCLFISWKASENAFKAISDSCWINIKNAVLKASQILNTRSYFSKRWIKNSFRNNLFINEYVTKLRINSPVILCASGPSLEKSIPYIKKNSGKAVIICVSSALSPLVHAGIIPDICITTDGGYWAKKHLSFALKKCPEIPVALPTEASVYSSIVSGRKIIPLYYEDSISRYLDFSIIKKGVKAFRNGTVSGTAALFALSLTDRNVYFCGLDLIETTGFSHTQPNELELCNCTSDNRLKTCETRNASNILPSDSLNIYFDWFNNFNFNGRLFRLSDDFNYSNKFNNIPEINWQKFNCLENNSTKKIEYTTEKVNLSTEERKKILIDLLEKNIYKHEWLNEIFPVETIQIKKSIENKESLIEELEKKCSKFLEELKQVR